EGVAVRVHRRTPGGGDRGGALDGSLGVFARGRLAAGERRGRVDLFEPLVGRARRLMRAGLLPPDFLWRVVDFAITFGVDGRVRNDAGRTSTQEADALTQEYRWAAAQRRWAPTGAAGNRAFELPRSERV